MALDETSQGNPICDICGNSGSMLPMLLYSNREKQNWEHSDPKEDHHVCVDPECKHEAKRRGWHFVR